MIFPDHFHVPARNIDFDVSAGTRGGNYVRLRDNGAFLQRIGSNRHGELEIDPNG